MGGWYLWGAQGQQGPYEASDLLSYLDSGHISAEWNVWREGMANWAPLGAVLHELRAPAAAAPPLPPILPLEPALKPASAMKSAPSAVAPKKSQIQKAATERAGCITVLSVLCGLAMLAGGLASLAVLGGVMPEGTSSVLKGWIVISTLLYGACCVGFWNNMKWAAQLYIVTSILDAVITFSSDPTGIGGIGIRVGIVMYLWNNMDSMND